MAVAVVRVIRINDEKLYNKGHLIDRWAEDVARDVTRATVEEAPFNKRGAKSYSSKTAQPTGPPGFLKSMIDTDKTRTGTREFTLDTRSKAGYSIYVIKGTAGGAREKGDKFYRLPSNPGFGTRKKLLKFRGITPNNFMLRGLDQASITHPSLRG